MKSELKKEINGKLCELISIDKLTQNNVCSGCIAEYNEKLCDSLGNDCITYDGCEKIWKEI